MSPRITEANRAEYTTVVDRLAALLPEFAHPERYEPFPVLRVQCPRRHHIVTVVLEVDPNLHPYLAPACDEHGAPLDGTDLITDGWANLFGSGQQPDDVPVHLDRLRLTCGRDHRDGRRYDGVWTQAELLQHYAKNAFVTRRQSIILPN